MATKTAKKRRRALGADPLDALVPGGDVKTATRAGRGGQGRTQPPPRTEEAETPERILKERLTVHLPVGLIDRVKNVVYWTPGLTLAGLAKDALAQTVDRLEKKRGEAYPAREAELKGGRPLK